MYLLALGKLALAQGGFRRQKPLLLLAFLSLEGPRSRRYLAELFWPGASDNLNSLSVALSQLRRGTKVDVQTDEQHVWLELASDVADLRKALRTQDLDGALQLYRGPFLDGADSDLGEELEEWIFTTREQLAQPLRLLLLAQGEAQAAIGRFTEAASFAEQAWHLQGAADPEPEELDRFQLLLAAGDSPLTSIVISAASEYGIDASVDAEQARSALRRKLLGRDRELSQLQAAQPGSWLWLQGQEGMGKSTLLQQLNGTYMPARSGLPYASLEPLLAQHPDAEPPAWRQLLSDLPGTWLIDDWELMDEASRELLTQLNGVHTRATVIITSTEPAPFPVGSQLNIGPLTEAALKALEHGWEQTGGLPVLVAALLNGQSPAAAVAGVLKSLTDATNRFLQALSLLEDPDPAIVRQALGLSARATAECLAELRQLGLIDAHGQIRAAVALREEVASDPARHAELSLNLARCLPARTAHQYWLNARPLWEDRDLPAVRSALLEHAGQLLHRGFPLQASEVLEQAPHGDDVLLLRSRALERAGLYREAMDLLQLVDSRTAAAAAVRAAVLLRLGHNSEAAAAAQLALQGSIEERAWGQNTIGMLEFAAGRVNEAAAAFRRSAALWHAAGDRGRRADTLNNLAVMRSELGENGLELFDEAAELAAGNISVLSRVLLNRARVLERRSETTAARTALQSAADLTQDSGDVATAARIYNNLGALEHRLGQLEQAAAAYRTALELAAQAGEQRLLAVTLANLAELEQNHDAWQEAVRLFEQAGFDPQELVDDLPAGHPFRERSGDGV